MDYLNYKSKNTDWSETLNDEQNSLIKKGSDDILQGKTFTHAEAKQKIKEHIRGKIS